MDQAVLQALMLQALMLRLLQDLSLDLLLILLSGAVVLLVMALVAVVRAEFLRTRNFDFVNAARALGEAVPRALGGRPRPVDHPDAVHGGGG